MCGATRLRQAAFEIAELFPGLAPRAFTSVAKQRGGWSREQRCWVWCCDVLTVPRALGRALRAAIVLAPSNSD
eukprot:5454284-Lingulodinium_polyedra.AAC.1